MSTNYENGVIAWFVRNPVAANLLMVLIVVAGLTTLSKLRVEGFPSIPPNNITISVDYSSGSAASAEEGVAIKIEEALRGVQGIKSMSTSSDGSGVSVTLTKLSNYDLDTLYRDVKMKVDAISTLPKSAEKPVISPEIEVEDVIAVNLYGDVPASVLQEYTQELRAQLLKSAGIQKVNYLGRKTPKVTVQVDESQLQAYGLTISDVAAKVNAASVTDTGGELLSSQGKLTLKTEQQRYSAAEFASIPVKQLADGRVILLSDIAEISDDFENKNNLSRFNGKPSVGVRVKTYGNSNVSVVAEEVNQVVAEFRQTLPASIHAEVWDDRSKPIEGRLALLMKNSFQGIVMVIALLALFLNIRVALWVGLGLPVIFAGALTMMGDSFFGMSLNELTTFGFIMALGIVVDDAVVIGESIYEEREKRGATLKSTIAGAGKVAVPTTFGVLTTMVAFVSISLVEGELGKIFAQFAYAAAFCLLFSLIESKLILPSHLAHVRMHSNSKGRSIGALWNRLQGRVISGLNYFTHHYYKPFLNRVLAYRYAALAMFIAVFIAIAGLVPSGKIKVTFFPEISSDYIVAEMVFEDDAGYGLVQRETLVVEQLAEKLNKQLADEYGLEIEPIQQLLTETSDTSATITVGLSSNNQRPFTAADIARRWQELLPPLEGMESINLAADMISEKDISIELKSKNAETISEAGIWLMAELNKISGVSGIKSGFKNAQMQVDLELKPQGIAMGLSSTELLNQLKYAYQGYEIQRFQKGENEIKVKIQYPDSSRGNLADLQQTEIRLSDGRRVALTTVASISTRYVATKIERLDYNRVNLISANVDKKAISPEEVLIKLENGLFKELKQQYRDLEIGISGEQKEKSEITNSLYGAFAVAMVAIYALLAIPLKSYVQPVLIMLAIPFGIVGALLGHLAHDIPVSLLSMFGILALSGVVVNDSLLLISRYNNNRKHGLPVTEAILESGTGRLRAILLTSTTTYAGLAPLLAETSPQAQFLIPAAASMGYGILFATIITLILIPSLVMIVEDIASLFNKKNRESDNRELAVEY
ncbi:efflux RND transporter permease subunit [Vibrio sp. SCSIO 43137]|uniref:efflux RND transporter permease subunit n=1 Tax=Vibrio sp. SCSIO 43137 TaxID=3021011 RepID=UPI0023079B07|nr:efflux RND transporter permease subunit [Vibrio sp. SCSIO 43137]WCE32494.1 efflux RND transporter permease subunit [Vibrio sp. SCSIO 43137]